MLTYRISYIVDAESEEEAWQQMDEFILEEIKQESTVSNLMNIERV